MKTYLFSIALLGLSTLASYAQDDSKVRNDVTYSVHNYKHLNKAAAALKWSNPKGAPVAASTITGRVPNYKQQVPGAVPTGGVTLPHTPQPDIYRNYKIQRVTRAHSVEGAVTDEASKAGSPSNADGVN